MSSTLVMTLATPSLPPAAAPGCCPGCGFNLPLDESHAQLLQAQAKIRELENQVRLLNEKATAAVDRWADYEDELTKLRAQSPQNNTTTANSNHHQYHDSQQQDLPPPPPPPKSPVATNGRMSFLQSGTSRLSALLAPRKSTPELRSLDTHQQQQQQYYPAAQYRNPGSPNPPASPSNEDLLEALSREQNLRKEAETQVAATSKEIEELSAALFEQANEMVAEERRARAKLEERVGELERRDAEKRRRLEKLEGAMNRIERVRILLAEESDTDGDGDDESDEKEEGVRYRKHNGAGSPQSRRHDNDMKPLTP